MLQTRELARTIRKIAQDMNPLVTPDETGVLPLLQSALQAEYQQWDLYQTYKTQLMGEARDGLVNEFDAHAEQEAEHIGILQRHIVAMDSQPTAERRPIPTLLNPSNASILALQLKFELEAVQIYTQILEHMGDSPSALRVDIENIIVQEQEHAHDLQFYLRKSSKKAYDLSDLTNTHVGDLGQSPELKRSMYDELTQISRVLKK